jgi:hypothetical protein
MIHTRVGGSCGARLFFILFLVENKAAVVEASLFLIFF